MTESITISKIQVCPQQRSFETYCTIFFSFHRTSNIKVKWRNVRISWIFEPTKMARICQNSGDKFFFFLKTFNTFRFFCIPRANTPWNIIYIEIPCSRTVLLITRISTRCFERVKNSAVNEKFRNLNPLWTRHCFTIFRDVFLKKKKKKKGKWLKSDNFLAGRSGFIKVKDTVREKDWSRVAVAERSRWQTSYK